MTRPHGGDWCCVVEFPLCGPPQTVSSLSCVPLYIAHLALLMDTPLQIHLSYTSNIEHISVFLSATDPGLSREASSAHSCVIAVLVRRYISLRIAQTSII